MTNTENAWIDAFSAFKKERDKEERKNDLTLTRELKKIGKLTKKQNAYPKDRNS